MANIKNVSESKLLTDVIIEGIRDKKGKDIVLLDLTEVNASVCDYFVICTGDSNTQVNAIGGSIEEYVRKGLNDRPWHKEGYENCEWVLLDYVSVVVHIFQNEPRDFYNLEQLWADAKHTKVEHEITA